MQRLNSSENRSHNIYMADTKLSFMSLAVFIVTFCLRQEEHFCHALREFIL